MHNKILSSYDQDQSIIAQCSELVKHWLIMSNCISCWLIKSKVNRKPNARMSLPGNMCTEKLKTVYSCLPLSLCSIFVILPNSVPQDFCSEFGHVLMAANLFVYLTIVGIFVRQLTLFLLLCCSALWGQWVECLESMHEEGENMRLQKRDWNPGPRNHTASVSEG